MMAVNESNNSVPMFTGRMRTFTRILWYAVFVVALIFYVVVFAPHYWPDPQEAAGLTNGFALALGYTASLLTVFTAPFFLLLAAVLFWRAADNRIAYYTSLSLLTQTLNVGFGTDLQNLVGVLSFVFLFWIFPTGRLAPRWLRFTVLPILALSIVWWLTGTLPVLGTTGSPLGPMRQINSIATIMLLFSIFPIQIYRYLRVYNQTERQQVRLVVLGVVAQFAILILAVALTGIFGESDKTGIVGEAGFLLWSVSGLMLPLALALSVLRYRLWAVDVIIRRTLQYALITLLLGGVYFGGVVLLQTFFERITGQESPLAVVASTLAIAALFNPLRHRVQNFIDRRFDRRKYDAQRTMDEFAASVRDEVDIHSLEAALVSVVNETMQPQSVSLWVAPKER